MFDITSSKLLLLGIVALLVIGPKDFPALLRTIGKYVGIIRGHAKEFRAQFDEAMRESELADLKKDVEKIAHETESSFQSAARSVEQDLDETRQSIDSSIDTAGKPDSAMHDPAVHHADNPSPEPPQQAPDVETIPGLNGQAHAGKTPADAAGDGGGQTAQEPARPAEKSGA